MIRINTTEELWPEDMEAFERLYAIRDEGLEWVQERKVSQAFPDDPETKLPSLPVGYFWRVGEGHSDTCIALIHESRDFVPGYRQERFGPLNLFSRSRRVLRERDRERTLAYRYVSKTKTTVFDSIRETANAILRWLPRDLDKKFSTESMEGFYGDYRSRPDTMEE